MIKALLSVIVLSGSFAFAAPSEAPAAQNVDTACKADATTAGCGADQVGTGLMKCLWTYKKEHKKDFKISKECRTAMHAAHSMKHETQTK